jgi:hypothetical protein
MTKPQASKDKAPLRPVPATLTHKEWDPNRPLNWPQGQEQPEPQPTQPPQKGQAGQANQRRPKEIVNETPF